MKKGATYQGVIMPSTCRHPIKQLQNISSHFSGGMNRNYLGIRCGGRSSRGVRVSEVIARGTDRTDSCATNGCECPEGELNCR